MNAKTRDTRTRAQLLSNAYVEALVGVFSLRLPEVAAVVRTHSPQMAMKTSYVDSDLLLDAKRVVDECQFGGPQLITCIEQISAAFISAMWDLLTSHAHYDKIAKQSEIQFLRHLRNACGHDGNWNFSVLPHISKWRDKELKAEHSGKPIYETLLTHGDVALLLMDIDAQFFEQ